MFTSYKQQKLWVGPLICASTFCYQTTRTIYTSGMKLHKFQILYTCEDKLFCLEFLNKNMLILFYNIVRAKYSKKTKITSSGKPARATIPFPSPVHVCAEVAEK